MRRTILLFSGIVGLFLGLFVLANLLGVELGTEPSFLSSHHAWISGLLGIGLLIADVLIPVPSSLIMIGFGSIFGVTWGTLLSLIGGLSASIAAFAIGQSGQKWVERFIGAQEQERARKLVSKWGSLAIILSRPIPLLAESVAILAGSTGMRWSQMLLSSTVGLLPVCGVYAYVGAFAAQLNSALLSGLLVLVSAGLFWSIGKWYSRTKG